MASAPATASSCSGLDRGRDGAVGVDDVDVPAAPAGRRAATSRATSARARSTRPGPGGNTSSSPSATKRSGTRSATMRRSASAAAVPGPMAATRAADDPGVGDVGEEPLDAVGRREHEPVVRAVGEAPDRRPQGRAAVGRRLEGDGRHLDGLGPELAQAGPTAPRPGAGSGSPRPAPEAAAGARTTPAPRRRPGRRRTRPGRRRAGPAGSASVAADRHLLGPGAPRDRRGRGVRREAAGQQPLDDGGDAGHAHEHDDGAADAGDGLPVDRALADAGSSWPVTTVNVVDEYRRVTGMPA